MRPIYYIFVLQIHIIPFDGQYGIDTKRFILVCFYLQWHMTGYKKCIYE
jgi:hypothetical protein